MLRSTSSLSLLRFLLLLGVCLCLCLCLSLCLGVAPPFAAAAAAAAEPAPPIAGGFEVPRGRWPDAVAVLLRDGVCTGTLIAPDLVLTAGHCIDGIPVEVALDTTDYGAPGGERIRVAWARAYPDWPYRYDVGVVVLQHPARQRPRRLAAPCTA
ncbi:MAG TPA: trypsin-like serine protease, partial [Kofleriaceae bacterium]|nr:trypsin-like serine protease [Kofleriaceae bacterium]